MMPAHKETPPVFETRGVQNILDDFAKGTFRDDTHSLS